MTTSLTQKSFDPDEPCLLCGFSRESHGDANHEFSTDGQLIPKKKPDPPRNTPPTHRDDRPQLRDKDYEQAFLRLVDVLTEKKMLDAHELMYIFGGISHNAANRG